MNLLYVLWHWSTLKHMMLPWVIIRGHLMLGMVLMMVLMTVLNIDRSCAGLAVFSKLGICTYRQPLERCHQLTQSTCRNDLSAIADIPAPRPFRLGLIPFISTEAICVTVGQRACDAGVWQALLVFYQVRLQYRWRAGGKSWLIALPGSINFEAGSETTA